MTDLKSFLKTSYWVTQGAVNPVFKALTGIAARALLSGLEF